MIEKFAELELEKAEDISQIEKIFQEKLGVSFLDLQQALSAHVLEKAETLSLDMTNIAPLGDYSNLLEDNDSMSEFLKTEAHKPEHWKIQSVAPSDVNPSLISFAFTNVAVDDGDILKGFVFVSLQGKIKHAFAQVDD